MHVNSAPADKGTTANSVSEPRQVAPGDLGPWGVTAGSLPPAACCPAAAPAPWIAFKGTRNPGVGGGKWRRGCGLWPRSMDPGTTKARYRCTDGQIERGSQPPTTLLVRLCVECRATAAPLRQASLLKSRRAMTPVQITNETRLATAKGLGRPVAVPAGRGPAAFETSPEERKEDAAGSVDMPAYLGLTRLTRPVAGVPIKKPAGAAGDMGAGGGTWPSERERVRGRVRQTHNATLQRLYSDCPGRETGSISHLGVWRTEQPCQNPPASPEAEGRLSSLPAASRRLASSSTPVHPRRPPLAIHHTVHRRRYRIHRSSYIHSIESIIYGRSWELHLCFLCLFVGFDDWHVVAVCFGTTRPLPIELLGMRGPPLWLEAEVVNGWSQGVVCQDAITEDPWRPWFQALLLRFPGSSLQTNPSLSDQALALALGICICRPLALVDAR
ncbi:hypothetical protein G7Z17_g8760 [Cylindrodendrum hubeiense]|uniref:Uncharacterized protein n=1 Tax=Cylindrodendrum hubeiense TaxID=595255 RepID=A0A9P5H0N5_9HYPO|nr:hypothetical protein G7Z17_g8760 [Cylindrodendrum hubeiense]